ncbi:uncharacterized protein LOC659038 [Tribolium castaneum]|uniref:DUF229 domain containing protein n=1 Tax=Tribolium castaneum TaxID=7070 RepID=A0A139WBV6_TRICA|nr:PREDICTED: uncharacterized protein LOC659038 [Tribolium castaneum]KYB25404.1 hypothetical protein TcasGA2_TC034461 [Tribolium castaneum]|eukprot:XP_008198356.1 PREDICTED: uncharacterized protein LOC659038 [Tribolium castaneum]
MFGVFLPILCLLFSKTLQEKYILNNQKCKIPDLEIMNKDVRDIILPKSYVPCNKTELLTHVTKNGTKFELHLRQDLFPQYSTQNITCCYSYVTRNGSVELPDVGISISPCVSFHEKIVLEQNIVKVVCRENNESVVYENVHVTIKPPKPLKNTSQQFSVLLLIIDSISRLNFHRTMPETANFLKKSNFVEMKAYSKVADNSFPNCLALLTGFSLNQSHPHCDGTKVGALDKCPIIWKDFRQHGYTTAYAEDSIVPTFNIKKKGFTDPPTDFYFKPYMEATQTLKTQFRHSIPSCSGPEGDSERILNLAKDFAITFKHNPSFGIFWMNTFSHDDVNDPFAMDVKVRDFFRDLDEAGILKESFVFLLSDHGIRYGSILETNSGWLEERTPLDMISVPAKFKREFGREYENLKQNSGKFTNPYDMFMTLQHILALGGVWHKVKPSQGCPNCVSLFDPIPDRSCQEAAIPFEWCPCFGRFKSLNKKIVSNAVNYTLAKAKETVFKLCKTDKFAFYLVSVSVSEPDHEKNKLLFVVFYLKRNTVLATVKFKDVVSEKSQFYFRFMFFYKLCESVDYV